MTGEPKTTPRAETISRAYNPEAWDRIDRLRAASAVPENPASFWPDMREDMRVVADQEAGALVGRMDAALGSAT